MKGLIDRLNEGESLSRQEWARLIGEHTPDDLVYIQNLAREKRNAHFGKRVYLRGLIEVSTFCGCDCLYCGLRRSNKACQRDRLTDEEILSSCHAAHEAGLQTFVLQGGEDGQFTDERLCALIRKIKALYPASAITLSLGERSRESYARLKEAGADRYLLRHETADEAHYESLHPGGRGLKNRILCLEALKELGYQAGAGFMVGTPGQTPDTLSQDMLLLERLRPHMVGIGPFMPQSQTPLGHCPPGDMERTLFMLAATRLLLPDVLLPATTAVAVRGADGRYLALESGANVIMPNFTPPVQREKYLLYDGKPTAAGEGGEAVKSLEKQLAAWGYTVDMARGDSPRKP